MSKLSGIKIEELTLRLGFLAREMHDRKLMPRPSMDELARQCHIKESTLKDARHHGRISPDNEQAIADYCGFKINWPEWRKGTSQAFEERYRRDAKQPKTASAARNINAPLTPREGVPQAGEHRLAALCMSTQLSNSSEQWPIKFSLRCRSVNGYAIKRGFIDLNCYDAWAKEEDCAFQQAYKLEGTDVTIRFGAATKQRPFWSVEANSGILDDVIPDSAYCIVTGLAPDDRLTATFSVYIKNLSGPDADICQKDGKALGRKNRELILDRIAKAGLSGGAPGQVVLCCHEMFFDDALAGADQGCK